MNVRTALQRALHRRALLARGAVNKLVQAGKHRTRVREYTMMKEDNAQAHSLYQAGAFWEEMNRRHALAIWGGGLATLRNEYFNRTFSGPEPESRQVYRALVFLYLNHLKALDSHGFLDRYCDSPVGGTADQEIIAGKTWSLDFLQSVDEAFQIKRAWRLAGHDDAPRVFVELGAGYGRLAYVCRKMFPECTYVILDLPEALICASSWLSRAMPQEVVPYERSRKRVSFTSNDFRQERIWILGSHHIEQIAANAADVFINVYSFAEMPVAAVMNYYQHLDRITAGIFYTKQRYAEVNQLDSAILTKDDYPRPLHWTQLMEKTSTLYDNFFEATYATRALATR